jgi:hypothetical protein
MIDFIRGGTFNLVGYFQLDGATPAPPGFTGWSLSASLYNANGTVLIANLSCTWIDPVAGSISVSYGDTSAWPVGKARIDTKVNDPQGNIVFGPPAYIRIGESPLGG